MNKTSQDNNNLTALPSFMVEEDSNTAEETEAPDIDSNKKANQFDIIDGSRRDINFLSKGLIIAMLYVALNLDESDIQLSHLYRFLQEKHLDIWNLNRFIPDDIKLKNLPQWTSLLRSKLCTQHQIRALAMSLLRKLDLGTPKVPDLRKIIDNFLNELCLPNDIKPFIYSFMHYRKCDFLDINNRTKKDLLRMPDYEGTVMAYILVSIKICFGLDSCYENKLSDVVDKINEEQNLLKSYKIGKYSEPSERLFSFREWCSYLQFRKIMLSKHNLRIAEKFSLDVDDYVYLEHMEERPKNKEELSDKISMDIISRLPQEYNHGVIPKDMFIPTLTPLSDYTDIIIEYSQDPDIKLKLAEDFKRYSLKYACKNMELLDSDMENVVKGVNENNKLESKIILGNIVIKKAKKEMVYVKNCENRNWLKTNPPTLEHIICVDDAEKETNDRESDHGYDSEITSKERELEAAIDKNLTDQCLIEEYGENDARRREDDNHNNSQVNSESDITNRELQDNECSENMIKGKDHHDQSDRTISFQHLLQENIKDHNNLNGRKITNAFNHCDNTITLGHNLESDKDEQLSDHSLANAENTENADNNLRRKLILEDDDAVRTLKENDFDTNKISTDHSTTDKNTTNDNNSDDEYCRQIIQEEDIDKNIFDDCFEDITFKEECERNDDNLHENEDVTEDNYIRRTYDEIPDEDFDRRSDISDVIFPTFNPETFSRESTIRELILHACKKYKIPIPGEYRPNEPKKRRERMLGSDVPSKRKRTKYEGKATVKELLSNYYSCMQSDFVHKVQQEMSIAIRNSELENQHLQQNGDLSFHNLQVNLSITQNGIDSPAHNETGSVIGPFNEDVNVTNNSHINNEPEAIDIDLENTLFEDDEKMQIDDVIPKGDPKFDEKIYETDQLYIKIKEDQEDVQFNLPDDYEIDKIIDAKIEECENSVDIFKRKDLKDKEETDSEDEIPLSIIKEEKLLIEHMYLEEEKYERLINKEDIPEYKYWIRHYDRHFMLRSVDYNTKFNDELKDNTPSSFFFVIQECASILNCTNFHLYKIMQTLEEYLVNKGKSLKANVQNEVHNLLEVPEDDIK